jgi:hypothetical protein
MSFRNRVGRKSQGCHRHTRRINERDPTRKGRISAALLVELPGIEPDAEIALNCGNASMGAAKARETTRPDLRVRREALTASTRSTLAGLASQHAQSTGSGSV